MIDGQTASIRLPDDASNFTAEAAAFRIALNGIREQLILRLFILLVGTKEWQVRSSFYFGYLGTSSATLF